MKMIKKPPIVFFNKLQMAESGISSEDLNRYFPRYLQTETLLACTTFSFFVLKLIQFLIQGMIKIMLRPRTGPVGKLDIKEVEAVYDREAPSYDRKHHLTTRGMDMMWRRISSWCAVNFGRYHNKVNVLDLCTGTGLAIKEMVRLLSEWQVNASITGLDYNAAMLRVAQRRQLETQDIKVSFVRGDAMNLAQSQKITQPELQQFEENSFDIITQMFGIGGIEKPIAVFQGAIQLLKPEGQYFLTDMHRPIQSQPGEIPLLIKWLSSPSLEIMTYDETTVPLALHRLWGWRDTTLDFYLLPLITYKDSRGNHWGFKVISFEVESQRWWFGLPVMPVGRITVEKIRIGQAEYSKRQNILSFVQ